jgi:hypothetical protein
MIKLWKFLSVLIIPLMCLGLLLVPGAQQALAASPDWGYEIQPNITTVGFNEDFNVTVSAVCYAENADTWQIMVDFDETYLQVINITRPATLPTGDAPDPYPGEPTLNNTDGWVYDGYGVPVAVPLVTVNVTFAAWTIHFRSNNVTTGSTYLNFVFVNPYFSPQVFLGGPDYLNWAHVVNGTVKIGGPPTISVSPDNLTFNAIEEGENPPDRTLEVCSSGTGTLDWSLTDDAAWLSETPASGSLGADACEDVTVSVDATGMEAGDYSATITITGSPDVVVPVSLHIESAAPVEPVEPANLSVSSVSISPPQVKPGQEVTISFNVANTGGETGSYNAVLYINGAVEDSQSVSVAPGMTKNVIFTVSKSDAGVYDVLLAGQSGQFEVVSTGWFGGGLGTSGIVAIVVIVIALIVALVFVLRRTRRAI